MNKAQNLVILQDLLGSGSFHHATYRNQGTLWEGLWIYRKSESGFRGFDVATTFLKSDENLEAAYEIVRHSGVSLGTYGKG